MINENIKIYAPGEKSIRVSGPAYRTPLLVYIHKRRQALTTPTPMFLLK